MSYCCTCPWPHGEFNLSSNSFGIHKSGGKIDRLKKCIAIDKYTASLRAAACEG